jgi:hypothetical protein
MCLQARVLSFVDLISVTDPVTQISDLIDSENLLVSNFPFFYPRCVSIMLEYISLS